MRKRLLLFTCLFAFFITLTSSLSAQSLARKYVTNLLDNKSPAAESQLLIYPSLAYAPAIHNKLLKIVEDTATAKKIPVQFRTLSRSTGTDTDSFAYANDGCPSVLISIPLRYMHTTVEMIHKKDITDTIQLMYETLLNLSPKTNLSYL
jgi:putative aminopeptidase FrvX